MAFASADEQDELVDQIAQAVIDRIEERDRINSLADMVVARVFALQREENELMSKPVKTLALGDEDGDAEADDEAQQSTQ